MLGSDQVLRPSVIFVAILTASPKSPLAPGGPGGPGGPYQEKKQTNKSYHMSLYIHAYLIRRNYAFQNERKINQIQVKIAKKMYKRDTLVSRLSKFGEYLLYKRMFEVL